MKNFNAIALFSEFLLKAKHFFGDVISPFQEILGGSVS